MRYVSASEAKQRLAALLDAAQREPVTIRRQNRDIAVVISIADYRRLTSTNVEAFQRFCDRVSAAANANGMTAETLDELLSDSGELGPAGGEPLGRRDRASTAGPRRNLCA